MRSLLLPILIALVGEAFADASVPQANDSPQHKLIIRGTKDARLKLGFKLDILTTNDECREYLSLPGVYRPRVISETRTVAVGQSQFTVEFWLDKYLSGKCGWTPTIVKHSYSVSGNSEQPGWWGFISVGAPTNPHRLRLKLNCKPYKSIIACWDPQMSGFAPGISSAGDEVEVEYRYMDTNE